MKIYPNIPVVYKNKFPSEYVNDVRGWAFSKEEIQNNLGKLLTLDIDFGTRCSLNCPHCFRKNNKVDKLARGSLAHGQLGYFELINIVNQAKDLGLRSIKFLGKKII